ALEGELNFDTDLIDKIDEEAELVNKAFKYFKSAQINIETSVLLSGKNGSREEEAYKNFILAKKDLEKRLKKLTNELNIYLAKIYGKTPRNKNEYEHWLITHQPFHWFAEFYEIINSGGFDVIIGNPPYIEYSKIQKQYKVLEYETLGCGNIYTFIIERSLKIANRLSGIGIIIPLSFCAGERMIPIRNLTTNSFSQLHIVNFEIFPSKLFDGAFQRLSIVLGRKLVLEKTNFRKYISKLHRWYSVERDVLLDKIQFTNSINNEILPLFFKTHNEIHSAIYYKNTNSSINKRVNAYTLPYKTESFIYYQEATNYWMKAICRIPFYKKNNNVTVPAHGRCLFLGNSKINSAIMALLNSSLFYTWYIGYSDGFHLSDNLVRNFPISDAIISNTELVKLSKDLEKNIKKNSVMTTRNTKTDNIEIESLKMVSSKNILNEIDIILAKHYGFTEEELDFIINYDIKYRMGKELEEE
ncbi:MAG: hypothetical protein FJW56_07410, partial [Actinobacteria bacterium]|nr:hypothetical protein [Actinomycetota bacterium]